MAKKITKNTTVYSAAAWWRDSDPSMQAVSLSSKKVAKAIEELMDDAAEDAYQDGSYESANDAMDQIRWSGIHAFSLKDLASARELEGAILELESVGIWYPNVG